VQRSLHSRCAGLTISHGSDSALRSLAVVASLRLRSQCALPPPLPLCFLVLPRSFPLLLDDFDSVRNGVAIDPR
jgi:hypothetical protein